MKNCTVQIIRNEPYKRKIDWYDFDDYRIAIALCNLLDNIENVEKCHKEY